MADKQVDTVKEIPKTEFLRKVSEASDREDGNAAAAFSQYYAQTYKREPSADEWVNQFTKNTAFRKKYRVVPDGQQAPPSGKEFGLPQNRRYGAEILTTPVASIAQRGMGAKPGEEVTLQSMMAAGKNKLEAYADKVSPGHSKTLNGKMDRFSWQLGEEAAGFVDSTLSPLGILTLGVGPKVLAASEGAGAIATGAKWLMRITGGALSSQQAEHTFTSAVDFYRDPTPENAAKTVANGTAALIFAAPALRGSAAGPRTGSLETSVRATPKAPPIALHDPAFADQPSRAGSPQRAPLHDPALDIQDEPPRALPAGSQPKQLGKPTLLNKGVAESQLKTKPGFTPYDPSKPGEAPKGYAEQHLASLPTRPGTTRTAQDFSELFDRADKLNARAARQKPIIPETGEPESVSRAADARDRISKQLFDGKKFSEIESKEDRGVVDDLVKQGYGAAARAGELLEDQPGMFQELAGSTREELLSAIDHDKVMQQAILDHPGDKVPAPDGSQIDKGKILQIVSHKIAAESEMAAHMPPKGKGEAPPKAKKSRLQ